MNSSEQRAQQQVLNEQRDERQSGNDRNADADEQPNPPATE
jgi:hypothetical protein